MQCEGLGVTDTSGHLPRTALDLLPLFVHQFQTLGLWWCCPAPLSSTYSGSTVFWCVQSQNLREAVCVRSCLLHCNIKLHTGAFGCALLHSAQIYCATGWQWCTTWRESTVLHFQNISLTVLNVWCCCCIRWWWLAIPRHTGLRLSRETPVSVLVLGFKKQVLPTTSPLRRTPCVGVASSHPAASPTY